MRALDLTGQVYGRLSVLCFAGNAGNKRTWRVQCACGKLFIALAESLRAGNTKSCGCKRNERAAALKMRHGEARVGRRTPEWLTWRGMRSRCTRPSDSAYSKYGGRGVTVHPRWLASYEAFLEDMGRKPSPKHSIDRINPFGNYEPGNCRWATASQQARNRRKNYGQ